MGQREGQRQGWLGAGAAGVDAGEGRAGSAVDVAESTGGKVGRRCRGHEGVCKDCRGGLWGEGGAGGRGGVKSEGNGLMILRGGRGYLGPLPPFSMLRRSDLCSGRSWLMKPWRKRCDEETDVEF